MGGHRAAQMWAFPVVQPLVLLASVIWPLLWAVSGPSRLLWRTRPASASSGSN